MSPELSLAYAAFKNVCAHQHKMEVAEAELSDLVLLLNPSDMAEYVAITTDLQETYAEKTEVVMVRNQNRKLRISTKQHLKQMRLFRRKPLTNL